MITIEELTIAEETVSIISDFISCNEFLLPDPFSKHVDIKSYAERLNRLGITFVCKDNEEIAGLISGYMNDVTNKCAYIQVIIVAEQLQGKGIGTCLIKFFIDKAKIMYGNGTVFLTVDKCNEKAFRVYTNIGFTLSNTIHANEKKMIMEYKL
ncbi:GNAT family N-acetyltransferase [Bacteroides intestinalis]|jgi:ribosomal protein S18 acetylase RimI-like enzyme|uniref:GNAT family N-acetyltransferase n=1 Tax=Bacteroides intestinalis TaxID=329854 RepID=UPI000E4370B8|nr:GNAT family N-acetyltransferase [Bacteroides intestinalis]RGK26442.1 GNAT family N-acetyltransferase [Bacteroides intestinalis]RGX86672.1 GNAT family N-acetyltransferase [Bacteroides intestinalis]